MGLFDYSIVAAYLIGMVFVGLYMQKRASTSIDSYFLGDRKIPWWALGISGMASNLDISGTMINTAFIFALGASGFFIEIRGGVTLIMAFLMIFQGKWNRRAMVMTLAEWMHFRFGKSRQGDVARLIAAISIIIVTIAMITYFAVGSGKFIAEFLGIPSFWGISSEFWAATLMIVMAMMYTVVSGLHGVVWTDVIQAVLIFGAIVYVCFIAVTQVTLPPEFNVSVPLRDGGFMTVPTTREAWTSVLPSWNLDIDAGSFYSIYNMFGIAIIFYLIKVIIEGSGGTSQYMIQRFFSARSDRESGWLSLLWIFLLSFRWPFICALAVMAVSLGSIDDPERVLPAVINRFAPVGVRGFLVAGLMAAAMSTFAPTVNAGAAYWVKDIYQSYINPKATPKQLMRHSHWSSILMVALGLAFSLAIKNINEIWGWITSSLGAGLLIPTLARWYWWRMNGYGFAAGTVIGMLAAVVQRMLFPEIEEYFAFLIATVSSLAGMIIGTYVSRPTDEKVLFEFYKRTRPFGFWGPIRKKLAEPIIKNINRENRRDILAIFFAVPWQVVLFLTGMSMVLKRWDQFGWLVAILVFLSVSLYFSWFKHLSKEVEVD